MVEVTCQNPGCAKLFSFDKSKANSSPVAEFHDGAAPGQKVAYFVSCPHCKARQEFTARERK